MDYEIVWLGHDNYINFILMADGEAVPLSAVTKMTLTFDGLEPIESLNDEGDPILWDGEGYDVGEIRIYLGAQNIPIGEQQAKLAVYDSINVNGVAWGYIYLTVRPADPVAEEEPEE